jgi:pimeloyl-ACP methyl ester carboxylesterase
MYTTINNQQIYYQKLGKGKDLVVVHGWGQDVSSFWSVAEKLKDDFTLWLLDLPGHGRSSLPEKPSNVGEFADIVAKFIKLNKLNKPNILGHSLGGNTTIKLAVMYPDLINKVILEDSSGIRPKRGLFRFVIHPAAKIFKYGFPNIFGLKDRIRHKLYWKLESDYLNAGGMKGTLQNILSEDLIAIIPKIKHETLFIWGEKDQAVRLSYGKLMNRLIPNARIEVFDNVGHFPHLENEKLFVQIVKDFLR